jgi:hypothetical protein
MLLLMNVKCKLLAMVKSGCGKSHQISNEKRASGKQLAKVTAGEGHLPTKLANGLKSPRSRYVPVGRNFAVFGDFSVSKNQ